MMAMIENTMLCKSGSQVYRIFSAATAIVFKT